MRLLCFFLASLFVCLLPAAECDAQTDSASSAGSTLFKNTPSKRWWMGTNYRKEWLTPVKAPVIHLSKEHGGLTPVKRGGGKQTKTLRLEDAQGREYTLRSIQKFITSKTLPGDLQSEAAADLVADGVSASYPYAALSVGILANAAGIPHGNARLVYIPDDPKLGEHRADFANMLALYEQRLPDSVKKGFNTDEVVEKLKNDNDNDVDQHALLRVRILDMFMMDLDRHEDQWIWGAWDNGKGKTYFPVAKDRDQAFYINDGFLPGIVKWPWLVPQLEGFKAKAKNINRFNFAARNLDRFFLNQLNENDWKQATDQFLSKMTDAVIDKALDQQPPEIRSISADKIKATLKERRQYLAAETMQYYRFLSETVSITGSDKKELFEITRNEDGSVQVQVIKITKEGNQSTKMYDRTFDPGITKEVRLYGFGGEDKFTIKGNNDKIKIRIIGGDGEDMFENTGSSNGGVVYDAAGENNKLTGRFRDKISNDTMVNSFDRLGYKYNVVSPFVAIGFNQDDGLLIGPSLKIIRHGFRKNPYKTMHQVGFNFAFATKAFSARWYSEYIGVFGKNTDLLTDFDIKAPNNTTNFFGYGNNSVYDKSQPGRFRYYRARYSLGDISVMLRKNFSPKVSLMLGPVYQFYSLDQDDKFNSTRFITDIPNNGLDPATLYEKQSYFGGKLSLLVDTRDNRILTRKGVVWQTTLRHLAGMNDASYDVTQLNADFTFYLPLGKGVVLTNRIGGGHNFGDGFEFYQAQYLGLEDNLRGYRKFRFAGQSKFFNNTELRMKLANLKTYLFPASFGMFLFVDNGRVWADGYADGKMRTGYGGGLWFAPLNRMLLSIAFTASKEDKLPLIGVGWRF